MQTLQEQMFYANPRIRAFAQSATDKSQPGWRNCDGVVCPLGMYYRTSPVGPPQPPAAPNPNPDIAVIERAVIDGVVVYDTDGIGLVVAATGQNVGLIGGVIVRPGDAAPAVAPPAAPAPAQAGSIVGMTPIPSPTATGGIGLTLDQANAISSVSALRSDVDKIKATLAQFGMPVA